METALNDPEVSDIDVLLNKYPQLTSDIVALGYSSSKEMDPQSKVTDKDFGFGLQRDLGVDLSSTPSRAAMVAGLTASRGAIAALVHQEANDMRVRIPQSLGDYRNHELQQGDVSWEPPSVSAPKDVTPTAEITEALHGGSLDAPSPFIKTEKEYNALKAKDPEAMPKLLSDAYDALDAIEPLDKASGKRTLVGPKTIEVIRRDGMQHLNAYAKTHPDQTDAVNQSMVALDAEAKTAVEHSQKAINDAKASLIRPYLRYGGSDYSKTEVKDRLSKYGLTHIKDADVQELLDDVNKWRGTMDGKY